MKRGFSALLAVLLSAGCAPAASAPAVPSEIQLTAARLDDLNRRINGTVEELRASERLNYVRVEGGIASCMAAAGRPYIRAPFVSFYTDFTDADLGYGTGGGTDIDSLTEGGRRMILNEIAFARLQRAGAISNSARVTAADSAVYNRCAAPFDHRLYYDVDPPAGVREFPDPTTMLSDPTGQRKAARADYRTCMKQRYGYTVDDDRTDFLYGQRLNRRDAPIDGATPNAAWTRDVAHVRTVFAADADCRRPAYELAMRQVADGLDAYEQRHRAQLDTIRAAWRQRVADADELPG